MNSIALTVDVAAGAKLTIAEGPAATLEAGGDFYAIGPPFYDGPYEITPGEEAQTLHMEGMRASQDVTVKPIPKNYGLVTRTGANLTIT